MAAPNPVKTRLSGNNGYFYVYDRIAGNKTKVPFYKWEATTTINFVDRTNTEHYSSSSDLVFRSSIPVSHHLTASIHGRYRVDNTPDNVVAQLFIGQEPFRVELGFSDLYPYVDIYAWIENFIAQVNTDGIVDFSCTIRSEGEVNDLTSPLLVFLPNALPKFPAEDLI